MTREEFKSCYDRNFDSIRSYLYYRSGDAELATDLAQEAFMKIWEKQPAYEPNRITGLLYKIAGDSLVNHFRKNKAATNYMTTLILRPKSTDNPEKSLQFEELKQSYERALAELPENQRVTFLMSRLEELSYQEIADRLGLSIKAVEKRMSLAIGSLKQKLKYHG